MRKIIEVILIFLCMHTITHAQQLAATPVSIDFGRVANGEKKSTLLILTSNVNDGGPRVQSVKLAKGAIGIGLQTPTLPVQVVSNRPLVINVEFTASEITNDSIEIGYFANDVPFKLTIPVKGDVLCTSADDECEPIRPVCIIDKNLMPWVSQRVSGLSETVQAALLKHMKAHNDSVSTYELPGSYFQEALGLSKLFEESSKCCDCGGPGCLPPIKFTKIKGSVTTTRFVWRLPQAQTLKSKPNPASILAEITLPSEIRGKAVIRASGIEYIFSPGTQPSLKYEYGSALWFDGKMRCLAPSSDVTVLHATPKNSLPNKHFLFTSSP